MKTCILDSSTGSYHFDPGLVYIRIGEQRVIAIFEYNPIKLEPEITSQYVGLHMANQAYCRLSNMVCHMSGKSMKCPANDFICKGSDQDIYTC